MSELEGKPIQTLRISDKEKSKLVQAMNSASHIDVGCDPARLQVTASNTNAVLVLYDTANNPMEFAVIAYSHGRRGISLIHGRYIHPETRCRVRF